MRTGAAVARCGRPAFEEAFTTVLTNGVLQCDGGVRFCRWRPYVAIASGLTNAEIGVQRGVTTGTVTSHVNALLTKLQLRDRVQATILAYESGLIRPQGSVEDPAATPH